MAWTEPAEVPKGEHEVILRADSGSRVRVIELSVFGKPEEGKVAEYKGGPSEDLPTSEVLFIELRDNARKPGDPPGTTGVLWYKEATVTGDDIRSLSLIFRATDGSLHTLSAKDAPLRSVLENDLRVWLDAKGMPSWI
ncbi:hypothetical protein COV42_00835 [Candidatus Campbellbacteria bacterium CG11_big_fil_rev_8_21_14_0_20_44_21]|nr:MAG: hypothetical protein COV42_00835 [Candidatus Campbellbacteria bacterium CG11_big_fil_rev_8_21_14_0_20_44_21]